MNLAFELSGENENLAKAEVLGYLASTELEYQVLASLKQLLLVEINSLPRDAASRLAMTHRIIEVLGICNADEKCIVSMVRKLKLDLEQWQKFCVRVRKTGESKTPISTVQLEKKIGELIHRRGYSVDLKNPDAVLRLILSDNLAIFGKVLQTIERGKFEERSPQLKPFFHPGVLLPHIARALVNISQIKSKELLLDPFCGTGGVLVEAGLAGAKVIGSDFQSKMVRGAKLNLDCYKAEYFLFTGDACNLPLKHECIDSIVTDPPYGRSARIGAKDIEDLYRKALIEMHRVLKDNKIAIVVAQQTIESLARDAGFEIQGVIKQRVHKSMTRHIYILRK